MSSQILAEPRTRLDWRLAANARCAALIARVVVMLPPSAIEAILRGISARTRRPDWQSVSEWRTAINSVSRRCAGQGCLQRSVAVVILARRYGVAPTWRTGFRTNPFTAHAWVEVEGVAVDEPAAVTDFAVVLSVEPRYRDASPGRPAKKEGR